MIDRTSRDAARHLLEQFMAGEISCMQLAESYPSSTTDGLFKATTVLNDSAAAGSALVSEDILYMESQQLRRLDRYMLFLASDFEYTWQGVWPKKPLLHQIFHWDIAERRATAAILQHGDLEAWPFRYQQELEQMAPGRGEELCDYPEHNLPEISVAGWWLNVALMLLALSLLLLIAPLLLALILLALPVCGYVFLYHKIAGWIWPDDPPTITPPADPNP